MIEPHHLEHPAPGLVDSDRHVLDPVELRSHELGHVDLLPAGKALGRLRRRTVRPERGSDLRPLARRLGVRLVRPDAINESHDPARRPMHDDRAMRQPCGPELLGQTRSHLLDRLRHDVRRQLLDADLESQPTRDVGASGRAQRHTTQWRLNTTEGGMTARPHRRQLARQQREAELLAPLDPQAGHLPREPAHHAERLGALRRRDGAARVEDVEGVRALEDVRVRRDRQPHVDEPLRLGRVALEEVAVGLDVGVVEVVARHLVLALPERLAVADPLRVLHVLEVRHALERHHDPLDAVGQLDGDGVEILPAHLLEVGELRDLHAVEPDLPAQAPRTDGGWAQLSSTKRMSWARMSMPRASSDSR